MKAKRILIIDDERPLLETLEMFLTEKGYAVMCAMSASEGLKSGLPMPVLRSTGYSIDPQIAAVPFQV